MCLTSSIKRFGRLVLFCVAYYYECWNELLFLLKAGDYKFILLLLPLLLHFAGAGTIGKRFDKISLENVEDNRRNYRQLLFQAGPEMAKYISGVIMFDETFFQKSSDGTPLVKILQDLGIIPGIKVDKGTVTLAGTDDEFTTQGWLIF